MRVIHTESSIELGMMPYPKPVVRVSSAGSISTSPRRFGSFHGLVITPSPLVSMTVGHQPCDAISSPLRS